MATVYLIHLEVPLGHACHYLGYTALESVEERLARHQAGRGARMLAVCNERGIKYAVVRTWEVDGQWAAHDARTLEKKLKNRHRRELCPVCNGGNNHVPGQR